MRRVWPKSQRLTDIAWIGALRREAESDMSVFHRIDTDTYGNGARWFELAELLPYYDGAVRGRVHREATRPAEQPAFDQVPPASPVQSDELGPISTYAVVRRDDA